MAVRRTAKRRGTAVVKVVAVPGRQMTAREVEIQEAQLVEALAELFVAALRRDQEARVDANGARGRPRTDERRDPA